MALAMALPGRKARPPVLAEPASPDDLEEGKYRKRRRRGHLPLHLPLLTRGVASLVCGVLFGLLFVRGISKAHERFIAPTVQQAVAEQRQQVLEAAEQRRRGMLLERQSGAAGGGGSGWAAAGPLHTQPTALTPVHRAAAGGNCTVRLQDADAQLLQREVDAIVKSLSAGHPWLLSLPDDAQPPTARQDIVTRGQQLAVQGTAVGGVADESYGRQRSANVPGVEDLHAELAAYNAAMLDAMVLDATSAAARQRRTRAAELPGLLPADPLNDTASIPHRIAFLNQLHDEVQAGETLRVCLTATTSADVWGVRRELLPWMQYHTELGAAHFYLLYDGQDAEAVRLLGTIRHVTLIHIHPPFASAADQAKFDLYARGASAISSRQWAGQPGNFELMVKQGYGEQEALRLAAQDGMHWLLHLDPDELIHPGGPAFSLTAVLGRQPPHVSSVRFMNFEGQPEAGDLTNRVEQVTLFRVHKHFITPEAHFYRQKYKLGDSAAFLTLYANGKSAVRVDAPGVRPNGPHFFAGNPSPRWQTAENPQGEWRDVVSDDTVVLHYAYSYPGDVTAKARRSCPDSYLEAARSGNRAKVKDCFVIEFDQDAYVAAAQGPAAAEDFFFERMVLSEGARIRCIDPELGQQGWCTLTDIERFKFLMEKVGLYRRLHTPQMLLRQHERQIQRRLRQEPGRQQQQQQA